MACSGEARARAPEGRDFEELDERTDLHAVAERARVVFAEGPPLRLAIVFGSVAKGTARPGSDIDIGILPMDANLSLSDEMDFQARLTLALRREVDLVRLDTTDTLLRWEAAKHGVILHANPASERALFLGQAASEHADFAEAVKSAMALYLRRMRERAARGAALTDPLLLIRRRTMLREHLARIVRRRPPDVETFAADVDPQDALAMSLLVCLQESADIALHLAADENWGVPASYADGFEMLANHGVIEKSLAREMTKVAMLRNRLAHGYSSVDARRVWAEVPAGVAVLERFEQAVGAWVEAQQSNG